MAENTTAFSLATHNGYITVHNTATGDHRTFRVKTSNWGEESNPDLKRTVELLIGPDRDNWQDWRTFAFVEDGGMVRVWRRFKDSNFEKFAKILADPERGKELGLTYLFEGACRVCNRPLTNPDSIESGIGPICAEKSL